MKNKKPENIKPNEFYKEPPGFHLCLVVKDRDKTIEALSKALGLGPWMVIDAKFDQKQMLKGKAHRNKIALTPLEKLGLGRLGLEIIQPVDEDSLMNEFLKTKGEGLHHIGIMVSKWDDMASKIEKQGAKKVLSGLPTGGSKFGYFAIEPGGLLVEIVDDEMPDWEKAGAVIKP